MKGLNTNIFEDSLSNILPNNLVKDLVSTVSRVNVKFGLDFGQPLVVDMGLPYKMQGKEVSSFYNQARGRGSERYIPQFLSMTEFNNSVEGGCRMDGCPLIFLNGLFSKRYRVEILYGALL